MATREEKASTLYRDLAHKYVAAAIRHGDLKQLDGSIPCVDCSAPASEYEHRDYLLPLSVDPVCRSCNQVRGPGINRGPQMASKPSSLRTRFEANRGGDPFPFRQAKRPQMDSSTVFETLTSAHQQYRKDASDRRKIILRLHKKGEKQVDIARTVGLTRERVRQIINEAAEMGAK